MYRTRVSNRALSGPYAGFIGKTVTWECNNAPASPDGVWEACTGRVVVAKSATRFYVDENGTRHWVDESYETCRNVRVVE